MTPLLSATLVLTYHRVAAGRDPLMQCVHPERFADQMKALSRLAEVVPVSDVTRKGRGLRVAVTFDDGYADNLRVAAPVLREAGAPATFSIVARILDDREEFWWDRLEHLLLDDHGRGGPEALAVEVGGRRLRVDIRTYPGRERAVTALNRRLRVLPAADVALAMSAVEAQLGRPQPPPACVAHEVLDRDEVRRLAEDELFEVASHGMTHTMLSATSGEDESKEIGGAKEALEHATGGHVRTFVYPYGTSTSFTADTVRTLRAAGFERALLNTPGLVGHFADRFRLPRFMVYDWTADRFERQVREWVAA